MKPLFSKAEAGQADDATIAALGRSARALNALARAGLPVPEWFLILPEAFQQCFSPWQLQAFQQRRGNGDNGPLDELVARAALPAALTREIEGAVHSPASGNGASDEAHWLVRPAEEMLDPATPLRDGKSAVVTAETVPEAALQLWRKGFRDTLSAGMTHERRTPAPVLVQRLGETRWWGTASSADPETGRRNVAVVEAFYTGFPSWPGEVASEHDSTQTLRWEVSREDVIVKRAAGAIAENGPGDAQAINAARLARAAAACFGEPQRIVWSAFVDGSVVILDAVLLPGLMDRADPDAPADEWLRGPVGELGGGAHGLVSPLSFSLVRAAFAASAHALAQALDVPPDRLAACEREGVFRRLVGQARGRLCLHLPSVRRFFDLLPDDGLARRSFETAFVHPTSPDRVASVAAIPVRSTLLALARQHRQLRRLNAQFSRQLDVIQRPPLTPHESQRPDELLAAWRELETLLQQHWQTPALNAYLALVCDGLLRELSGRWCSDAALPNALLAGRVSERGAAVRPSEPAQRVREMAELVQNDDALIDNFTDRNPTGAALDSALAGRPRLAVQFGEFLENFALLAAPGHLLIEAADLRADPLPLTRTIGHYARGFRRAPYEPPTRGPDDAIRRAESTVQTALRGQRWRAFSYRWLLKQTRARLLEREAHGRTTARLVAHARAIFLALGQRFSEFGALGKSDDIYFLTVEEIAAFLEGTAPGSDLHSLVTSRRRESEENARLTAPAERFTTRGAFHRGNDYAAEVENASAAAAPEVAPVPASGWRGVPGFPGVARGRARRVSDARSATVLQGEILVAERAEAGWGPLLAAASGFVVEHGSTLSRVAVVARDLGIPAVFAVPGIFEAVRDGEILELNGTTGTVTRVGDA